MSVLTCNSLRSAFARLCSAIWRVIRPAPPLIIYLCVPSRMRNREIFNNRHNYSRTVDSEDIETTNPTGNNGYLNQAIDISQEENQQEMFALGSHETATIQTGDAVNCLEIQTQV